MTYEQINELIEKCLLAIHYYDTVLLDRKVREECVNHRLAFYLETFFPDIIHDDMYYNVDLEYNKNLSADDKQITDRKDQVISIRPDIIIHKRPSNSDNLLAIEAKLRRLNNHDLLKMEKVLYPPYNYKWTAAITYLPRKEYFTVILFSRDGETIIREKYNVNKPKE